MSRRIASNSSTLDLAIPPGLHALDDHVASTVQVGPDQTVTTAPACHQVGPNQAVTAPEEPEQLEPDQSDTVGPDEAVTPIGLLLEAVGAFGYSEDGSGRANALANLHDVGVAVWPIGFVLLMVGTILSVAVLLAATRGAAGSRIVKTAAVVAIAAATAFIAGGFIFGY